MDTYVWWGFRSTKRMNDLGSQLRDQVRSTRGLVFDESHPSVHWRNGVCYH